MDLEGSFGPVTELILPSLRFNVVPGSLRLAALAVLPLLAGCPSLTMTSSARTLRSGEVEQAGAIGLQGGPVATGPSPTDTEQGLMLIFDYAARFGLGENLDLELRVSLPSAGSIGPRFQILRAPEEKPGIDILLTPSLGFAIAAPVTGDWKLGTVLALALPVGVEFGGGNSLVLAPRIAEMFSGYGNATMAGGSIALVVRVAGDSQDGWYIIPECGFAGVSADPSLAIRGPRAQCGLGLAQRKFR
jgi:hypothetical protein